MKIWLCALGMCQTMFCSVPFPWHGWEEKAREKMLLCLPIIGLEVGLLWWAAARLCGILEIPEALRALVLTALPLLLTGFIHLDGFMDVTDAVRSYRSLERRREILKDSHVGSFAVIGIGLLLLAMFAAAFSLNLNADIRGMILIPVVSRCCSVLAVLTLPPMTTSQYAGMERRSAVLPILMLLLSLGAGFLFGKSCGLALVFTGVGYCLALLRAYRSLQGMNGDISGYSLSIAEVCGLAAMALLR